jgi:hypothetical protein
VQDRRRHRRIVEVAHEENRLARLRETLQRRDDPVGLADARRLAGLQLARGALMAEMRGRHEDRAIAASETHPEKPPVFGIGDVDLFSAVLDLAEQAGAPPDVAFPVPSDQAVVHAVVAGEHFVDDVARPRHELLRAEDVRIEKLEELAQRGLAELPALDVPDVVGDDVEAEHRRVN